MRDKLFHFLLERAAGASPRELLDLIFTQPGADPEFGPRFLHTLLDKDSRFVWRVADGRWTATVHDLLARPLADTTFVVVDLETTGNGVSADGIIEIGAARVRGGRVEAEFQQLVNPGVRLSPFITQLTGIDDALLADQPRLTTVWPQFVDFLGDDVIVAHNARFDVSFLDAAALAYQGRPLAQPHLCTLKLARRLLPALRRRGLDALAAHFGIPQVDRHRALGDVRITVEIFFQLFEQMAARGVLRLDQALDLQHAARDGRRFVCLLPRGTVEQLPTAPGIYRFFGEDGRLLYVGKAKNLRERVTSYLSNAAGHSNKTLDLIRHCRDVRVHVLGSELEAALEEAAAIRQHKPPYNRLGKHLPRIAFLKLSLTDEFPRLSITNRLGRGRSRHIGPFRNREEAERVLGTLTRLFRLRTCAARLQPDTETSPCFQGQVGACSAPCAARVTAETYRVQVSECLALLAGDPTAAAQELARRRDELAAQLRFEAAARAQRDIDQLERLVRRQRTLGWIAAQRSFVIFQPAGDRSLVLAYVVLNGRLVARARLSDASHVDGLAADVQAYLTMRKPKPQEREAIDGTTIVAAWLRDRGETEGCVLQIDGDEWRAIQIDEWRAACASLLGTVTALNAHVLASPHPEGDGQRGEQPRAGAVTAIGD